MATAAVGPKHSPIEGPLSDTATQGVVCQRGPATIVVFAGTDPGVLKTVLTEAEAPPDGDGMHPGFLHALEAMWEQVLAALRGRAAGSLFVTGHSLGAALAALAAFRLQKEADIEADAVYTFGLPRVGGEAFGKLYEPKFGARTFRLVNGDDPVPSMPPSLAGYRHVGRRMSCPHGGTFGPGQIPVAAVDDQPTFASVETDYAGHVLGELLARRWPIPAQPRSWAGSTNCCPAELPIICKRGFSGHLAHRLVRARLPPADWPMRRWNSMMRIRRPRGRFPDEPG